MKYVLFLAVAAGLVFTACKKKKTDTHCYLCTSTRTQTSNVPALAIGTISVGSDTICNFNEARINDYMKTHKRTDTVAVYGDTLVFHNWESTCIVE